MTNSTLQGLDMKNNLKRNEDKQIRNLVSFTPANFEVSKIYQKNVQSPYYFAQLFVNSLSVVLRKKSKIVGKNFSPALEMQFGRFY